MITTILSNRKTEGGIQAIRHLVANELNDMNQLITEQLASNIPLIETIAQYIIESGGKQIRPLLTLLVSKMFGYEGEGHYHLSTVIEFVHTATLLHDDVIDTSKLRRGKTTAHEIWGNQASVLVGDFLYSRAFQILTKFQHGKILSVLANATNGLVEAEMNQLVNKNNPNLNEEHYLKIIQGKTASLFAAASEIGAVLANSSADHQQAIADYGLALGTAFQVVDDLLDYTANAQEIGKNIGDDLAEGKVTLPLIYTLMYCDPEQRQKIQYLIQEGKTTQQLPFIMEIMQKTLSIDKTYQYAMQFANQARRALHELPNNIYRQALLELVDFVVARKF